MKKSISLIGLGVVAMTTHGAAIAFIDERTPEPPAMVAAPLIASAPQSTALFEQSHTQPLHAANANLIGSFNEPIWQAQYPGPFGTMPIADAIIAQIVPVKGAVRLDGDAKLLSRSIVVPTGKSRYETLLTLAQQNGVSIDLSQGNQIVVLPAKVGATLVQESIGPDGSPQGALRETVTQTDANGATSVETTVIAPGVAMAEQQNATAQPTQSPTLASGQAEINPAMTQAVEVVTQVSAPKPIWEIDRGVMLSAGLRKWFEDHGWQLVWRAKVDYQIVAPVRITDDFLSAVDKILDAYKNADRPLVGYAHEDQRVIVVTEPGLKNASVDRRPVAVTAPPSAPQATE